MAGIKISNEVGATVFVLLSAFSALFFTAWIFGNKDSHGPKLSPVPDSQIATEDTQELNAAREALAEESARRAELAAELRENKSNLSSLEKEKAVLTAQLAKLKGSASLTSDLDAKLSALNLKLKATDDSNAKLSAKIADLQAKLKALEDEKSSLSMKLKASGEGTGKMAGLAAELAALKLKFAAEAKASQEAQKSLLTLKQSATDKEKSLLAQIEKLNGAMTGDSGKLAAELKSLKLSSVDKEKIAAAQLARLRAEVDALTKKLTGDAKACEAATKKLMAEINTLNGELDGLKNGDKLKRAGDFPDLDLPLLVNDPMKLDARVRPLFINLRGISDTAADREATYKKIIAQGNSSAKDVVQFDSGSSEVTATERKELEAKLKGLGKDSKILAVGYASVDGDAKSNHELSSKRASSVAQEVARITGLDATNIQAVYFGQTKRFDEKSLTPNRVVEVWVTK